MEDFAVLMMLGVRVREVRNLSEDSLFIEDVSLLLIDDRLETGARDSICRQLLGQLQQSIASNG